MGLGRSDLGSVVQVESAQWSPFVASPRSLNQVTWWGKSKSGSEDLLGEKYTCNYFVVVIVIKSCFSHTVSF